MYYNNNHQVLMYYYIYNTTLSCKYCSATLAERRHLQLTSRQFSAMCHNTFLYAAHLWSAIWQMISPTAYISLCVHCLQSPSITSGANCGNFRWYSSFSCLLRWYILPCVSLVALPKSTNTQEIANEISDPIYYCLTPTFSLDSGTYRPCKTQTYIRRIIPMWDR